MSVNSNEPHGLHDGSEHATEQTALIPPTDDVHHLLATDSGFIPATTQFKPRPRGPEYVVNLLCAILFLASCFGGLSQIPLTQLIEDALCQQRSGQPPVRIGGAGHSCKDDDIQSKVAFIFAIASALDAVVGFLSALPWGIVADRIGRRPVFSLALVGGILAGFWWMVVLWLYPKVPIHFVWFASFMLLLGGGNAVLVGVSLSMITDVTIDEDMRAIYYMRLHVASMAGNLISPALSSTLMNVSDPWLVLWTALACFVCAAVLALLVPETMSSQPSPTRTPNTSGSFGHNLRQVVHQLSQSISVLTTPLVVLFVVLTLGHPVFPATVQILIQFVSKRYALSIKDAGFVQTAYGIAQVFQSLVVLPFLSRLFTNTAPWPFSTRSAEHKVYILAYWSFLIMGVGALVLGAAPTLVVFIAGLVIVAMGTGYSSFLKALMSMYVDQEHRTRLFTMVGMVDVIGSVYSGPALAALFSFGMRLGGGWIGLPYYGLAAALGFAAVLLLFVRLPGSREAG